MITVEITFHLDPVRDEADESREREGREEQREIAKLYEYLAVVVCEFVVVDLVDRLLVLLADRVPQAQSARLYIYIYIETRLGQGYMYIHILYEGLPTISISSESALLLQHWQVAMRQQQEI
jgi:hypothetical protein